MIKSPSYARKCSPCLRYKVLPMSQESQLGPLLKFLAEELYKKDELDGHEVEANKPQGYKPRELNHQN